MTQPDHDKDCTAFLDRLDAWLEGEYVDAQMLAHHDACSSCRNQARLARKISGVLAKLPLLTAPEIHTRPAALGEGRHGFHAYVLQMLQVWRQPLVFLPALAVLLLMLLLLPQLRAPGTAVEPELVIIDGREYTRAEIRQAAEDLQLALRYIERYQPARVISAELDPGSDATNAPVETNNEQDGGTDAPTI